jgi:hypothetical protein
MAQDNLHDKSHLALPDDAKSKRSQAIDHSDVKSKKSHQSEAISDAPSKKQPIVEKPEDTVSHKI